MNNIKKGTKVSSEIIAISKRVGKSKNLLNFLVNDRCRQKRHRGSGNNFKTHCRVQNLGVYALGILIYSTILKVLFMCYKMHFCNKSTN